MKIFISNTIFQFKTRFIPEGCVILPMTRFGGINIIIANIRWLQPLQPTEIICETKEIIKAISPHFKNIPISLMSYSNGVEYCPNFYNNNIKYIIITSYFALFIYSLILDNLIQSMFLSLIHMTIFIIILLWYSDSEKWENNSKKVVHV